MIYFCIYLQRLQWLEGIEVAAPVRFLALMLWQRPVQLDWWPRQVVKELLPRWEERIPRELGGNWKHYPVFFDEEFSFKNGILVHILHIGKLMDEETGSVTSWSLLSLIPNKYLNWPRMPLPNSPSNRSSCVPARSCLLMFQEI